MLTLAQNLKNWCLRLKVISARMHISIDSVVLVNRLVLCTLSTGRVYYTAVSKNFVRHFSPLFTTPFTNFESTSN